MNTLFVTYTLDNNTIDYPILSSKLKSFPDWIKLFNRAWIIKTPLSSKRVRDELDDIIGSRGRIVVINITDSPWATAQIDEDVLIWMKKNI